MRKERYRRYLIRLFFGSVIFTAFFSWFYDKNNKIIHIIKFVLYRLISPMCYGKNTQIDIL